MSKVISTSQWIQFFLKAGLPSNIAANYAIIFSDNRIQLDMLLDLTKEYLFDMGIKVMGDVIAILRYAKEFHSQLTKEQVIGHIPPESTKKISKNTLERVLGHYSRPNVAAIPKEHPIFKEKERLEKKSRIIALKKSPEKDMIKKMHILSREEEGIYRIKMPSGNTEKTRRILQQQRQLQLASKKSVFDRLGESTVSSSTDDQKQITVFERLGILNKSVQENTLTTTVMTQGAKQTRNLALQYQGVLKSPNIIAIKKPPEKVSIRRTIINPDFILSDIRKTMNMNRINSFKSPNMANINRVNFFENQNKSLSFANERMSRSASQGILGQANTSSKLSIKSRLGLKEDAKTISKQNSFKKRIVLDRSRNVFDRLGKL